MQNDGSANTATAEGKPMTDSPLSFEVKGSIAEYRLLMKAIRSSPDEIKYRTEEPVSMWEKNFADAFKEQCGNKKMKCDVHLSVVYFANRIVGRSRPLYTQKIMWTITKVIEKYVTYGCVVELSFSIMQQKPDKEAFTSFCVYPTMILKAE